MTVHIGWTAGALGVLAADTRLWNPVTKDGEDRGDALLPSLKERGWDLRVCSDERRKLRAVPGPAWAASVGASTLTGQMVLDRLERSDVASGDSVQSELRAAPEDARRYLREEVGFRDHIPNDLDATFDKAGVSILRPGPDGVEFWSFNRFERIGGPNRCAMVPIPPTGIELEAAAEVWRRCMVPSAEDPDAGTGDVLLAIARTFVELQAAGCWSISTRAHVGVLLQGRRPEDTLTARVDFDAPELLERYRPAQLSRRVLKALRKAQPRDGYDPEPVDLTFDP